MNGIVRDGCGFFLLSLVTFYFSLFTLYTMELYFFTFSDALCALFFPFFVIIQFASRCTLFKEEMRMKMRMKLQNHGWGVLMTYRTWPPSPPSPLLLFDFSPFLRLKLDW